MLRQRIKARSSRLAGIGRALVGALSLALVWYGLMLVLLTFKVDPGFVNSISGYRSAYDYLAALTAADIDATTRAITATAGFAGFLLFGFLTMKALPRPHLTRHDRLLSVSDRGDLVVEARAIERVAEIAARQHEAVSSARARTADERMALEIGLCRARRPASDLTEIRTRALAALETHGLGGCPVDVTVIRFDRKQRRELE